MSTTPRALTPAHKASVLSSPLETRPVPLYPQDTSAGSLPASPLVTLDIMTNASFVSFCSQDSQLTNYRALFPRKKRAKHPPTTALCQESAVGLQGNICCPFGKMRVRPSEEAAEASQAIPRQVAKPWGSPSSLG